MKRKITFLSIVSAIGLLFISGMPVHASSAFPGENGRLAFTGANNGSLNVWTMDENGDHMVAHTSTGARNPIWSPNGEKLLFVSTASKQLFVVDSNGSNRRDLIWGFAGDESEPVWQAGGSRIAFTREKMRDDGSKQSAIFTVAADGTDEQQVTDWSSDINYRSPSWSPDGTELVYEAYGGHSSNLQITNLMSDTTRVLTSLSQVTDSAEVAWSPNGKKILYRDSANEIYTIWPDGTHRAVISDGDSYAASWSPDGTKIVFLEDWDGEDISISGEDGEITVVPIEAGGRYRKITEPSWSPDGNKLVFALTNYKNKHKKRYDHKCACVTGVTDVFVLDLTSGNRLQKIDRVAGNEFNWQAL